ncbi:hypothetical protein TRVL_01224 [Trypanosoma vivax]|nr:hypothetical protein TRVL_01224 [Trypanosoma vivax]
MEPLSRALQLQHTRCEAYRLWDAKLHCALRGALSAADFQVAISHSIVAVFQRVSTALRELQDSCRDSACAASRFLCSWVDRVQSLEQQHYQVSVHLAQLIVQHCTHNSAPSEYEKGCSEASFTSTAAPDAATVEKKEVRTSGSSLHDMEWCALRQLIPVSAQVLLRYVLCNSLSLLSDEEEEEVVEVKEGNDAENERDSNGCAAAGRGVHGGEGEVQVRAAQSLNTALSYRPGEVHRRCADFNAAALPLWHTRERLREALRNETDELQEEISCVSA